MSDGDDRPRCGREDCDEPAVAVYEGADPPAGAIRYRACSDCAPDDVPPVRTIGEDEGVDVPEPTKVSCTVCPEDVGRGPGGLGLISHANKHRRQFREKFGRRPENYDEVRDALGRGYTVDGAQQMTLTEALDSRARTARRDELQADLEDGGSR